MTYSSYRGDIFYFCDCLDYLDEDLFEDGKDKLVFHEGELGCSSPIQCELCEEPATKLYKLRVICNNCEN